MKLENKRYGYLEKDTVDNILKPLRKKWKMRNYSLVINRLAHEWLMLKDERKGNPHIIAEQLKKLIKQN